jgi:hypothetical protein
VAHAATLWAAIEQKRVEGLLAAHGFTTTFLVAKQHGREAAALLRTCCEYSAWRRSTKRVVRRAVALETDDFEDAVSARREAADAI